MSDHVDRRTHCRFKVPDACGAYRVQGVESSEYKPCEVLNMSKGGLAIRCETPVPAGTVLYVLLTALDEDPLELYARTCWFRKGSSESEVALGIEYYPFDDAHGKYGYNPYQAHQTLERLEARYLPKSEN